MKDLKELASVMTTISAAIGAILGWMVSIKWSKASMDAKEDIIRQKEEKIQHLEKNRDELLRLKDEQIKLLELQLKVRGNECRVSKKKSQSWH